MSRVLLSAFGIHAGGGRVLLEALLRELRQDLKAAALDARLSGRVELAGVPTGFVRSRLYARLRSVQGLAALAGKGDVLFCFNGLPPLRKPEGARVIVYLQGRHLLAPARQLRYPLRTTLRVALERLWLRLGARHCDELWVQTPAMAELAAVVLPGLAVRILPFVDDDLAARLAAAPPQARQPEASPQQASFFYPADGVAHKNHAVLVRAWELLAARDCRATLYLTLPTEEFDVLVRPAMSADQPAARIVNLGPLRREQVLQRIASSSALLFTSSLESFGLPLLEARSLGVPVLAAERDFVRDVCDPEQTFDPDSPRSIADAVQRFLFPGFRRELRVLSAREFARVLAA